MGRDSCTSCYDDNFLAVVSFTLDGPSKCSKVGYCLNPTKHMDRLRHEWDPAKLVETVSRSKDQRLSGDYTSGAGITCAYSGCTDGLTGSTMGYRTEQQLQDNYKTKQVACSRVCLIGGDTNAIKNLERTDGQKLEAKYMNSKYSSPVCTFYKVVLCIKPADFDEAKCAKSAGSVKSTTLWDMQTGPERCETCKVKKVLKCHAVVPKGFLGTDYTGFTDICKHVKDPCDLGARFL